MQDAAHDTPVRIHEGDARALLAGSGPERREERADPDGRYRHVRLFLQSPSFLHAQRQMLSRQGRSNAHTLFGIETIPSDNHVRKMLDGVPAGHFDPVFHHVVDGLKRRGALEKLRRLNGHLLVALDGTEYVSSTRIECPNCSTQKQSDGTIRHYHAMVGASIVAPGSAELLPLPPEFITPQDGAGKQDCERAAVKRWLARVGPWAARLKPIYLGDDLHCCQPVCEAIGNAGGHFILTCKPGNHTTLYEYIHGVALDEARRTRRLGGKRKHHFHTRWMNDLPLRDGPGAMKVGWFEITVTSETGKQVYYSTFATDITITKDNIAELAECARTRWTVENSVFRELKKFFHLEHNFGHGESTVSSVLAMFNLVALLMQSACQMVCPRWKAARKRWVARYQMLDQLKILVNHVVFGNWDQFLVSITTDQLPEQPP